MSCQALHMKHEACSTRRRRNNYFTRDLHRVSTNSQTNRAKINDISYCTHVLRQHKLKKTLTRLESCGRTWQAQTQQSTHRIASHHLQPTAGPR